MNTNDNGNGALNFARLIEEAEALLMGEQLKSPCTRCGNCNTGADKDGCAGSNGANTNTPRSLEPLRR